MRSHPAHHTFFSSLLSSNHITSRPTSRLEDLLKVLPGVLMCRLMVMKLLLQVRDLRAGLAALACKALVNGIDGNIDEPRTGDTNQSQFHIENQKRRRNRPNVSNPKIENEYRKTEKKSQKTKTKTEQNRTETA